MAVDDGVLTYHDLLDYITALTDGGARTKDMRLYREAILGAYRDVSMAAEWDYFTTEGRVNLDAAYTTGTIVYDHTGGANERQITLTAGTWPSWAGKGRIRFGDVVYLIPLSRWGLTLILELMLHQQAIARIVVYILFHLIYGAFLMWLWKKRRG